MNFSGLIIGVITCILIGLGFVWVIRGERYLGYLWWPYFMALGFAFVIISFFVSNAWVSILIGIIGGSFIWGSTEFKEQAIRAELGWYPFNKNKISPPFEKIIKKWKVPHL